MKKVLLLTEIIQRNFFIWIFFPICEETERFFGFRHQFDLGTQRVCFTSELDLKQILYSATAFPELKRPPAAYKDYKSA